MHFKQAKKRENKEQYSAARSISSGKRKKPKLSISNTRNAGNPIKKESFVYSSNINSTNDSLSDVQLPKDQPINNSVHNSQLPIQRVLSRGTHVDMSIDGQTYMFNHHVNTPPLGAVWLRHCTTQVVQNDYMLANLHTYIDNTHNSHGLAALPARVRDEAKDAHNDYVELQFGPGFDFP